MKAVSERMFAGQRIVLTTIGLASGIAAALALGEPVQRVVGHRDDSCWNLAGPGSMARHSSRDPSD